MKPTHQLRTGTHEDVTAWQFLKDNPMPIWVFRSFHDLGGGRNTLSHRGGYKVSLGDWIVVIPPDNASVFILKDEEFNKSFVELPKADG